MRVTCTRTRGYMHEGYGLMMVTCMRGKVTGRSHA